MKREPIENLVKVGFAKVYPGIDPVELHASITEVAFDYFHLSGAIPDVTRVEMHLTPEEIKKGFSLATERSLRAFDENAKQKAFDSFRRSADRAQYPSDCYCHYWLALVYTTGVLAAVDSNRSNESFRRAAEAGYPTAAMMLGFDYESSGHSEDAYWWYALAAECGWAWAVERKARIESVVPMPLIAQTAKRVESMMNGWDLDCLNRYVQGEAARQKYLSARIDKEFGTEA